jgi:L-2-hydroxyglutarate oxidase LhgO
MVRRVGVIGAGIVGLAVARRLAVDLGITVEVLEKEPAIAAHQTGHNSGVVHAGIYYPPGSRKAWLCRIGVERLRRYCEAKGIEYRACGKLVVAVEEAELAGLRTILQRGIANGVPGLRWLDHKQLREVEPHVTGVAAVHSPSTAVVDFVAVARAFAADVAAAGGAIRLGIRVTGIRQRANEVTVVTTAGTFAYDLVVSCAGLHADRVARLSGDDADPMIVPFRGEYLTLRPEKTGLVRALVYPVPDPRYPFLGVHLTRRIDGTVTIGPNAVLAGGREGYRWTHIRLGDLGEVLRWPGLRKMATQHWRTGVTEVLSSVSRRRMVARARRYLPELRVRDVLGSTAGVRAQAVDRAGRLVDDFRISRAGSVVNIRNAPSPAATSSMAIAEHILGQLGLGQG